MLKMMRVTLARSPNVLTGEKLEILKHCQRRNLFTDATLICESKFYFIHKLILASCSKTAREDFLAGGGARSALVLTGIHPHDVENVISLIYSGELWIPSNELPGLFKLARMLGIDQFEPSDDFRVPEDMLRRSKEEPSQSLQSFNHAFCDNDKSASNPMSSTASETMSRDQLTPQSGASCYQLQDTEAPMDSLLVTMSPIIPSENNSASSSKFFASISSIGNQESSFLDIPEKLRHEKSLEPSTIESESASHVRPKSSIGQLMDETCFRPSVTLPFDINSMLSPGHEIIDNETSIWTEGCPSDGAASSCLLNYGMCSETLPGNVLKSYSPTVEEIVKHVENLPSDIDTPPLDDPHEVTYTVQLEATTAAQSKQLEGPARPQTPVLMRSLGSYPTLLRSEKTITPTLTEAVVHAGRRAPLRRVRELKGERNKGMKRPERKARK